MIAIPSIFMLFLAAILSGVGIAVLRDPRHTRVRILLAVAMMVEFMMAVALAFFVALGT